MIFLFVLFLFFLVAPGVVFTAAKSAVTIWALTLVPSMLPFFILNDMLSASGGVALVGRILERPTQKLLKLPGAAGFILATGYSTGAPVSAVLIAELRRNGTLTRNQANRLLPFAANVSPVFILSAVSISMLNTVGVGTTLALIHYGSNLFLGVVVCLFSSREEVLPFIRKQSDDAPKKKPSLTVLTDALFRSFRTMALIGGLVIVFFILIAFCNETGIFHLLSKLLTLSEKQEEAFTALMSGILEITAGSNAVALSALDLRWKLAFISGILAFGGVSALIQIASQLGDTDLSVVPYVFYKIIQGALAFTVSLFLPIKIQAAAVMFVAEQSSPWLSPYYPAFSLYALLVAAAIILLLRHYYAGKH